MPVNLTVIQQISFQPSVWIFILFTRDAASSASPSHSRSEFFATSVRVACVRASVFSSTNSCVRPTTCESLLKRAMVEVVPYVLTSQLRPRFWKLLNFIFQKPNVLSQASANLSNFSFWSSCCRPQFSTPFPELSLTGRNAGASKMLHQLPRSRNASVVVSSPARSASPFFAPF